MPNELAYKAVEKIKSDLEWRGPNGSKQRYVVLEREQAESLLLVFKGEFDFIQRSSLSNS